MLIRIYGRPTGQDSAGGKHFVDSLATNIAVSSTICSPSKMGCIICRGRAKAVGGTRRRRSRGKEFDPHFTFNCQMFILPLSTFSATLPYRAVSKEQVFSVCSSFCWATYQSRYLSVRPTTAAAAENPSGWMRSRSNVSPRSVSGQTHFTEMIGFQIAICSSVRAGNLSGVSHAVVASARERFQGVMRPALENQITANVCARTINMMASGRLRIHTLEIVNCTEKPLGGRNWAGIQRRHNH